MKYYKAPINLYFKCMGPKLAKANAEFYSALITEFLRHSNSGWVTDDTTISNVSGEPQEINKEDFPVESYQKNPMVDAWGEDDAIRILRNAIDRIYK